MAIIQDWKISSRGTHCSHTETPFEDGDEFFTCIFDDPESDGFIRKDFSVSSWEEIEPGLEEPPFSFWKSTFKVPEVEAKSEVLEKNSAEGMLRKMEEEDDPATENARFILALMLERKKTLIPTDVTEAEERRLLVYKHKDTEEVFIVVDPQLRLDEIEDVQLQVADLLAGRANTPEKDPAGEGEAVEVEEGAEQSGEEGDRNLDAEVGDSGDSDEHDQETEETEEEMMGPESETEPTAEASEESDSGDDDRGRTEEE